MVTDPVETVPRPVGVSIVSELCRLMVKVPSRRPSSCCGHCAPVHPAGWLVSSHSLDLQARTLCRPWPSHWPCWVHLGSNTASRMLTTVQCVHCTVTALSLHSLNVFLFVLSRWVSNTLASLTVRELGGSEEKVWPEERLSGNPLASAGTFFTTGICYIIVHLLQPAVATQSLHVVTVCHCLTVLKIHPPIRAEQCVCRVRCWDQCDTRARYRALTLFCATLKNLDTSRTSVPKLSYTETQGLIHCGS